jgi:hypothetical protein
MKNIYPHDCEWSQLGDSSAFLWNLLVLKCPRWLLSTHMSDALAGIIKTDRVYVGLILSLLDNLGFLTA